MKALSVFIYSELHTHAQLVTICCRNTDLVHVNGHDRTILVIFSQVQGSLMMDPVWSETCWSTFKYFIILIVSTYCILCISWVIKCLITIDARCKHEDRALMFQLYLLQAVQYPHVQRHVSKNVRHSWQNLKINTVITAANKSLWPTSDWILISQ